MAERQEMLDRLFGGAGIVTGHRGKSEAIDRCVDEDGRQLAGGQPAVMVVRRVGLGIEPSGEHDARDLLLEEQVDVVGFGDSAGCLGAQHGRESLLRERTAHDLGERRKDGVLELREDEAHEAGALAAELRRPLVAQDVEGREDPLARCIRDAGLLVQDATDGRLGHANLLRHVRKSSRHAHILCNIAQEVASPHRVCPPYPAAPWPASRERAPAAQP